MTTIIYDLHAQVEAAHLHPLRHASINAERLNVTPTPKLGTNSQSQRLSVFPVVRHHREYFLRICALFDSAAICTTSSRVGARMRANGSRGILTPMYI
jgi:hypothetical protein